MSNATRNLALFCDFENIALGVRDARYARFDIGEVLERLLVKGNIVVKKAYCDWERYKDFKRDMHEASFELIEIPHRRQSGKNSADIRMVVDALDLCYTKSHVDTFVVISGDSRAEERAQQAFDLVMETVDDIFSERGDESQVWGSMVKQALKRRKPSFSESYHGFRSFGLLLEEMQTRELLTLKHDQKSGGYIITGYTGD
jgi:uncharacterized LabA/DUF88 family protein